MRSGSGDGDGAVRRDSGPSAGGLQAGAPSGGHSPSAGRRDDSLHFRTIMEGVDRREDSRDEVESDETWCLH